jgi:hypothetical protein
VLAHCWARWHACGATPASLRAGARAAQLPRTRPRTAPTPPPRAPDPQLATRQLRIHPRCSGTTEQGQARYSECASASQLSQTGAKQQAQRQIRQREGGVSCGQRAGPAAPPSEQKQVLIKGVRTFQHRLKHTVSTGVPTACPTLDQRRWRRDEHEEQSG